MYLYLVRHRVDFVRVSHTSSYDLDVTKSMSNYLMLMPMISYALTVVLLIHQ